MQFVLEDWWSNTNHRKKNENMFVDVELLMQSAIIAELFATFHVHQPKTQTARIANMHSCSIRCHTQQWILYPATQLEFSVQTSCAVKSQTHFECVCAFSPSTKSVFSIFFFQFHNGCHCCAFIRVFHCCATYETTQRIDALCTNAHNIRTERNACTGHRYLLCVSNCVFVSSSHR